MLKSVIGLPVKTRNKILNMAKQPGFSLIEILVVLIIIGIVVSFALLAAGNFGQDRKVKAFAEQITHTLILLEQQAVLEPSILGVHVSDNKIVYYRYVSDEQHHAQWQEIQNERLLKAMHLSQVKINITETKSSGLASGKSVSPQIIFFPSGEFTPFTLELRADDVYWRIEGKQQGSIKLLANRS